MENTHRHRRPRAKPCRRSVFFFVFTSVSACLLFPSGTKCELRPFHIQLDATAPYSEGCVQQEADSVLHCALLCVQDERCIAFNAHHDNDGDDNNDDAGSSTAGFTCKHCLSVADYSTPIEQSNATGVGNSTNNSTNPGTFFLFSQSPQYFDNQSVHDVSIPNGLYHNQVFHIMQRTLDFRQASFITMLCNGAALGPDTNMGLSTIYSDIYEESNIYVASYIHDPYELLDRVDFHLNDYVTAEERVSYYVFVTDNFYTIYINNRFLCKFPRRQQMCALSDIRNLHIFGYFYEVQWSGER